MLLLMMPEMPHCYPGGGLLVFVDGVVGEYNGVFSGWGTEIPLHLKENEYLADKYLEMSLFFIECVACFS